MRKTIIILTFGFVFVLFPHSGSYSQGLCEYCPDGTNKIQLIYVPASFNLLNSSLGPLQETATRLVVRNPNLFDVTLGCVNLVGPNKEVVKEYSTGYLTVPLLESISFSTPNFESGITQYPENEGRHYFAFYYYVPESVNAISPIIEAERSIINFNKAGNHNVQSIAITTHGTVISEEDCLSP